MMKTLLHGIVKRESKWISRLPFINKLSLHGATMALGDKLMIHSKICCKGSNNRIIFQGGGILKNCSIMICGSNNTIIIGPETNITDGSFWMEDNGNCITIGSHTSICGKTHLACIEGTSITIGSDCLFSSNIIFRTGDSHSIMDLNGSRINWSEDIIVGNHCWIGYGATVLKGVCISQNNVVSTGALVTKDFKEEHSIIGGNPAKVIKQNILWDKSRIAFTDENYNEEINENE